MADLVSRSRVGGARGMVRESRRVIAGAIVFLLATALTPGSHAANDQCSALTTTLSLTGAGGNFVDYFVATESAGGEFFVWRDGDNCVDGEHTRVWYSTQNATTDPGDLSLSPPGPINLYAPTDPGSGSNFRRIDVNVGGPIVGVEKATGRIDKAEHSGQDIPEYNAKSRPIYLLDTDGSAGFAFGEAALRGSEGLTAVIPVFRTGPVTASGSVQFEIEPMTATPGDDYTVPSSTTVNFAGTSRTGNVSIPIKADGIKDPDEQFRIRLVGGTGPQSEVVVTIVDTTLRDLRPKGRLHHPKQSFKYPQNYPWLNEIHIFTSSADDVRAPVTKAQLAIRKRWKGGSCAWWSPTGFRRGSCEQMNWFGRGIKNPAENYFKYKIKQKLPLSVGSKSNVDDYKIWGRWYDGEDRVSILRKGRNMNRFEVIKPTKACENNPFNFRKCKPVRP
jgi:Calx-beta domain